MGAAEAVFTPRKTPIQAGSNASGNAILQATVQVLQKEGLAKITTKKAARAGVSIGTHYQYFPNKGSLLHLLLRQQLDSFELNFGKACTEKLTEMAEVIGLSLPG